MTLDELYARLEARYGSGNPWNYINADENVMELIKIAKGMQKGLQSYESQKNVKQKALQDLTKAHLSLKFDYTWLHAVNTKLFNEKYAQTPRTVMFHRYITDYLFAHGFLKDEGVVRNIP